MKGYHNMFFPNQKVTRAEALPFFFPSYGVFQFSDNTVKEILARYTQHPSLLGQKKSLATALK